MRKEEVGTKTRKKERNKERNKERKRRDIEKAN